MVVNVKLFALAKQRAGFDLLTITLPPGANVADLRAAIVQACPAIAPLVPNMMIAINAHYATDDQPIDEGAEVAAIPPVSGG